MYFNNSFKFDIFLETIKLVIATPIFKSCQEELLAREILDRIIYNRLYKYLSQQNLLFERLRGFETAHSTEHTTAELANK